ncbi:hypothetical protein [Novosphingobium lindaniclasticum]|nr:hypothetical protein [Novosphingobium lindaniclasticum]
MARWSVRIPVFAAMSLLGCALVWACLHRGPWYDEFYSQFVTRPGVPWGTALRESWLADNHPPLYYILARATAWLGSIAEHRLLNLALGAAALVGALAIVRDVPRLAPAASLLALELAANPWTLITGSELRSYFLSLCAGAVFALGLCAVRVAGEGGGRGRPAAFWIAAILAFNTHIITSLTCAALALPFLLEAGFRRNWREVRAIGVPVMVSGTVFTAVTAIQLPIWLSNTAVFWIAPGFDSARWSVEWAVLRTIESNPVVLAAALVGAVLLVRDLAISKKLSGEAWALVLLAGGVVVAATGLVGLHLLQPILIEKYLMALIAAVCFGMALAGGRLLESLDLRLRVLVLGVGALATAWALALNLPLAVERVGWQTTGRAIAREVAHCPGTVVHTDPFWNAEVMAMMPRDNAQVVPFAYRYVARSFGFAIAPAGSREMAAHCPTVFWGEHDSRRKFDRQTVTAHLRREGFDIEAMDFRRLGDGWIAIVPPSPPPSALLVQTAEMAP